MHPKNCLLLLTLIVISWKSFSSPMPTPMSAGHLYWACKEEKTSEYARGFCDGAIETAYSSIQHWCVPPHITHGEVKDYIRKELLKTKPSLRLTANKYVSDSVNTKWPCSGESKP